MTREEADRIALRFETELECIQYGNRLVANDTRYKYFCTNIKDR